jgi:hypothetical protein
MSSSDSDLNVRPDAVRIVKEGLNSEYIIILTSNSEIMELTVTKHIPGLFSCLKGNIVTLMFIIIVIFAWLKKSNIHPETEGFIFAIQDRVINTRNYKKHICGLQSIN